MKDECPMAGVLMAGWRDFGVDAARFRRYSDGFATEVTARLAGKNSSLMMLPAFVGRPTRHERGAFLSLDFGGTNVRVAEVMLDGSGSVTMGRMRRVSLKNPAEGHDYTRAEVQVTELFDYLAKQVAFFHDGTPKNLGHSFSFASRQTSLAHASLAGWSKEIRVGGVAGQDIGELLSAALGRQDIFNIRPVAVVNDTTATLLAAAYARPDADLGSVCGTGHNTCCYEPLGNDSRKVMAFNAESGGFDRLDFTAVDDALDGESGHPGKQRLEKMVAGRYLGELTRRMLWEGRGNCGSGLIGNCGPFRTVDGISSKDAALFAGDETDELENIRHWLGEQAPGIANTAAERRFVKEVTVLVVQRAANLVAATYDGFLKRIDPAKTGTHAIGINGSLYEKMPGFACGIKTALRDKGGWEEGQVDLQVMDEAPLVGAAIAAAMAAAGGGI